MSSAAQRSSRVESEKALDSTAQRSSKVESEYIEKWNLKGVLH